MYLNEKHTFFGTDDISFLIVRSKKSGILFSISARVPFFFSTAARNEITWGKHRGNVQRIEQKQAMKKYVTTFKSTNMKNAN